MRSPLGVSPSAEEVAFCFIISYNKQITKQKKMNFSQGMCDNMPHREVYICLYC